MQTRISLLARHIRIPVGILTMLVALCGFRAEAAILQIEGGTSIDPVNYDLGWSFTPLQDLIVTRLGVWDELGNGLAHPRPVWISGGGETLDTVVPAGTAGDLDSGFRWVTLATPFHLSSGQLYTIEASYDLTGGDHVLAGCTAVTAPAGMYTYNQGVWSGHSGGGGYLADSYFGPNLDVSPVPEPRWCTLFASLFLGAICLVRELRMHCGVGSRVSS